MFQDFHCLPDVAVPPDSNLSKMTLDIIACSSYSLREPWHLAMVPMPQGQIKKGEIQFRLLDFILHCILEQVPEALPIGIATDGGTCNKITQDFLLGQPIAKALLEGSRFWSLCKSHSFSHLMYMSFGYVTLEGRLLVGSTDALHTLKRYTFHHHSCQRTIKWGAFFTDISDMLRKGLPVKSYSLTDTQSDEASFQRINPKYLDDSWCQVGVHLYILVSCLVSLCTEASEGLSVTARFRNATCAYSLLLLGLWAVRQAYDKDWTSWYLPIQTLRHLAAICTQQMALCTEAPQNCTVLANKFQEKVAEYHYGALKAPYRGVPSIRDAIVGGQLLHAKQLKSPQRTQPPKPAGQLTRAEAQALSKECWSACFTFQSWIMQGPTADEISALFDAWWLEEGQGMLAKSRRLRPPSPEDEEDEFVEDYLEDLEEDEGNEACEDENLAVLMAAEDHAKAKFALQAGHAMLSCRPYKPCKL